MSEPEEPPQESADDRADELDGMRIRQLATLRRAAYRSRSHTVIAMLVCAVAVVQSMTLLVRHLVNYGVGPWVPAYAIFAIASIYGAIFFMRRAVALNRELHQVQIDRPTTPPDFSTLSDGSQRWKNLEDLKH
jgi:hypothetical protein